MRNSLISLVNILELDPNDDKNRIKHKYYLKIRELESNLRRTEDKREYERIKETLTETISLYTQYFAEEHLNIDVTEVDNYSFATIEQNKPCQCRCGGDYDTSVLGITECDFCSCFVRVKEEALKLQ